MISVIEISSSVARGAALVHARRYSEQSNGINFKHACTVMSGQTTSANALLPTGALLRLDALRWEKGTVPDMVLALYNGFEINGVEFHTSTSGTVPQ
jgi:hypothetical protein